MAKNGKEPAEIPADPPKQPRLFGNWTGKTPVSLFQEFCQKQKFQKPNFYFQQKGNEFLCEIVISQKDSENVKFAPPARTFFDSKQMAKQVSCCYGLFRLRSDTNMRSLLPPEMRIYWDSFQKVKNDTDPDLIPLQYSSDPWEAKAKYEHSKKVELASSSNPWDKYPTLDIPKDIRSRLEIMIRDNLEDAVMGEINPSKDTKHIRQILLKKGFRPAHVDEALEYRSEIHDCLDWLSVHVPEDDLPVSQRPTDKKSIVIDNQTVDTIKHQYAIARLHAAGFNRGICVEYYNSSRQYEFHALVSLCCNLAGIDNTVPEIDDIESVEEVLEQEKQVLESIYENIEHELVPNVGHRFTVSLEIGKDILQVSVCIPLEGHKYPHQIPGIAIHSTTLPAYIRLALLQKVIHSAHASFIGSQMIFSILGLVEEHLAEILASPPPLTSLYIKGEKIGFLNDNENSQSDKNLTRKRKKWNSSGPSSESLLQSKNTKSATPEYKSMLKIRQSLPSFKFKSQITTAIASSQVLICCGETGCGKSTQLGQFILDEMIDQGLGQTCNIICTQPRRISAIALADRVSQERCEKLGTQVGYSIRGENKQSSQTKLLFCTTGILLRQIQDEPTLPQFSHVIIDEVHERGVDSDFLLVLLRDLLPKRPDLKVVLMSATIDASTLSAYFSSCPVIDIPGRTFPVSEVFLEDILSVTGHIPQNTSSTKTKSRQEGDDVDLEQDVFDKVSSLSLGQRTKLAATERDPGFQIDYGLISATVNYICSGEEEGAILIFMP
jgi:ATP-dependent RNA helicase DHX57